MHSVFTAQSIGNKWPSYALDFFYSPSPVFNVYVLRRVGMGTIPELSLRKIGILTLPGEVRIPT